MHHAAHTLAAGVRHKPARVVLGVAGVNDDGKPRFARQAQLREKDRPLLLPRRIIVVVIETALADRDRASPRKLAYHGRVTRIVEAGGIMRMNTGRIPYEARVPQRDGLRRASGAEDVPGAASGADADDRLGPTLSRAADYVAAVAVERFVCEVRVAVDERCATDDFFGHFR